MNLNKVFIIGNLTQDPELRQTAGGQSICTFGVATNRFYTDAAGQRQKQAEFHNVVAWGRNAELINQYLRKGSSIFVEGRLQTRNWLDQQGVKHWKTEIVAERIQLGPRPGSSFASSEDSGRISNEPTPQGRSTTAQEVSKPPEKEEPPVIELSDEGETIDVKDIPF
jgi:single-strand DNA-binding protein